MRVLLYLLLVACSAAQPSDPAFAPLQKAYDALRGHHYDQAIAGFQRALEIAPERAAIHKDLAYALLAVGESEAARDQFGEAMRLDSADPHVALEYAFLCYETRQRAEARRIFARIRTLDDPTLRATAEKAFQNIDQPLAAGIERWQRALELTPDNFSAHHELARLAEEREDLLLAAAHYVAAWQLRPDIRELLLDAGRVWKSAGRMEESNAALLAASRGARPRVAERARMLAPARYPYVYEFRKALELDPSNIELRRELGYLLLAMHQAAEAEAEFRRVVALAPEDKLATAQLRSLHQSQPLRERAAAGAADSGPADRDMRELGFRSFRAGYLRDALKYLSIAHEADPADFEVMLKLGWTCNLLRDDKQALEWFDLARQSPDPAISSEADRAWRNLRPAFARFRTTAWIFPFYSSRWQDLFSYAQVKTEYRIGRLPFRPYLSVRFVGDTRQTLNSTLSIAPQYLSESSFIVAAGIIFNTWRGLTGWFEAGEAIKYIGSRKDAGAMIPDYRGGLAFSRGIGHLLRSSSHGLFADTTDDGIYVSRYGHDMLLYSQNRTGYTLRETEGGVHAQLYWNWNATVDRTGQQWANFVETGPGVRVRFRHLPGLAFAVNAVRGSYLRQSGSFFDVRAGFWYAFTR